MWLTPRISDSEIERLKADVERPWDPQMIDSDPLDPDCFPDVETARKGKDWETTKCVGQSRIVSRSRSLLLLLLLLLLLFLLLLLLLLVLVIVIVIVIVDCCA